LNETEQTSLPPIQQPKLKSKWEYLKRPWLLVLMLILGAFVGHTWKTLGEQLVQPGNLYLSLLTMSVIPIISTAIISGLARMLRSGIASSHMSYIWLLFIVTVLIASGLGILAGYIGQPGVNLGQSVEVFIGQMLLQESEALVTSANGEHFLWNILFQLVPANVIGVFSGGDILGVIFVSIAMGTAIGRSRSKAADRFYETVEGIHEIFVKILGWVLYGLPIGLFCMIGGQVATLGMEALLALGKFVLVFYLAASVLCIFYLLVMRLSTGLPILRIISAIRDPLFVSFSAASCIAPLPIALEKMQGELGQRPDICNLVIPLTVAMNRHSYALLFSLTAIFICQLFGKTLDFSQILLVLFTSALIGTAAAGRLATVGVLLVYVLEPIGIPVSVAITIFISIGAILDPMVQMSILFGGCANAAVISNRESSTMASTKSPGNYL